MLTVHQKKAVAILTSDKADFRTGNITREKRGYYVMIKASVLQDDITTFNVNASNNREVKIHKAKTEKSARRNRQIHHYVGNHILGNTNNIGSWRLQHLVHN